MYVNIPIQYANGDILITEMFVADKVYEFLQEYPISETIPILTVEEYKNINEGSFDEYILFMERIGFNRRATMYRIIKAVKDGDFGSFSDHIDALKEYKNIGDITDVAIRKLTINAIYQFTDYKDTSTRYDNEKHIVSTRISRCELLECLTRIYFDRYPNFDISNPESPDFEARRYFVELIRCPELRTCEKGSEHIPWTDSLLVIPFNIGATSMQIIKRRYPILATGPLTLACLMGQDLESIIEQRTDTINIYVYGDTQELRRYIMRDILDEFRDAKFTFSVDNNKVIASKSDNPQKYAIILTRCTSKYHLLDMQDYVSGQFLFDLGDDSGNMYVTYEYMKVGFSLVDHLITKNGFPTERVLEESQYPPEYILQNNPMYTNRKLTDVGPNPELAMSNVKLNYVPVQVIPEDDTFFELPGEISIITGIVEQAELGKNRMGDATIKLTIKIMSEITTELKLLNKNITGDTIILGDTRIPTTSGEYIYSNTPIERFIGDIVEISVSKITIYIIADRSIYFS